MLLFFPLRVSKIHTCIFRYLSREIKQYRIHGVVKVAVEKLTDTAEGNFVQAAKHVGQNEKCLKKFLPLDVYY